jgi:hypothetical protein
MSLEPEIKTFIPFNPKRYGSLLYSVKEMETVSKNWTVERGKRKEILHKVRCVPV